MAGVDIQNRIKAGLARANAKTGDGTNLIVLNKKTVTAGNPVNPGIVTVEQITLKDAILTSYTAKDIDGDLIIAGDKRLVSNSDNVINQNDEIIVNGVKHIVVNPDVKNPSNVPLAYISQLRRQ